MGGLTNLSGTIAAGGTAQRLVPANGLNEVFFIQNLSSGDLWISFFGDASAGAGSIKIPAGVMYESPIWLFKTNTPERPAISIFGATTGQAFTAGGR